MLERLTFLLGIAVTAISWLFTQLADDLSKAPVLYYVIEGPTAENKCPQSLPNQTGAARKCSSKVITLENLSKKDRIPFIQIRFTKQDLGRSCEYHVDVAGLSVSDAREHVQDNVVTLENLEPGSRYVATHHHPSGCVINASITTFSGDKDTVGVRLVEGGGLQSFFFQWHFWIIFGLLVLFCVVFVRVFVGAWKLTRRTEDGVVIARIIRP